MQADCRLSESGTALTHCIVSLPLYRLFADLFESDIIVASPLALATKLAEDKRRAAGKVDRGKYATAAAAKAAKAAGSRGEVRVRVWGVRQTWRVCMRSPGLASCGFVGVQLLLFLFHATAQGWLGKDATCANGAHKSNLGKQV
eukprot:scaffold113876_cov16-Tisochrysis_lutea.AAC.1